MKEWTCVHFCPRESVLKKVDRIDRNWLRLIYGRLHSGGCHIVQAKAIVNDTSVVGNIYRIFVDGELQAPYFVKWVFSLRQRNCAAASHISADLSNGYESEC